MAAVLVRLLPAVSWAETKLLKYVRPVLGEDKANVVHPLIYIIYVCYLLMLF